MDIPGLEPLLTELNSLPAEVKVQVELYFQQYKCLFIMKALSSDENVKQMCSAEMSIIIQKVVDLIDLEEE